MIEAANKYLALPAYTLYRRQTGKPVLARIKPLAAVDYDAYCGWGDYLHISLKRSVNMVNIMSTGDPLRDLEQVRRYVFQPGYYAAFGLVEEEHNLLQAYLRVDASGPGKLTGIFSAPWNYQARVGDRAASEWLSNRWAPLMDCAKFAVRGGGWTAAAFAATYLYLLNNIWPRIFPLEIAIEAQTDANSFYRQVIGATVHDQYGEISLRQAEQLIERAYQGEISGQPGWRDSVLTRPSSP